MQKLPSSDSDEYDLENVTVHSRPERDPDVSRHPPPPPPSPPASSDNSVDTVVDDGLQTSYKVMSADIQNKLARKYSPKKQFLRLFTKVIIRLLSSILLSAAMVGCFKYYENIEVLSENQKNVFNLLSTGIYLSIGLNLAGSFKEYATMLRWRILARKPHDLLEVDLILGLSSLMKVFKLSLHSLKNGKFIMAITGLSWIFVNCVGRVSVALTGLAYSYDSAGAVGSHPGIVQIADTRYFWPSADTSEETPSLGAQYQTAHLYGEFSAVMIPDDDDDLVPKPKRPYGLKWNNQTKEWIYHFKEYNPHHHNLFVSSNRSISVSTMCSKYEIVHGEDGGSNTLTFYNHTAKQNTTWDISDMGAGNTIYAVQFKQGNNTIKQSTCPLGPRCAVVLGFQFLRKNSSSSRPDPQNDKQEDIDNLHSNKIRRRRNLKRIPKPLIHPEFNDKSSDNTSNGNSDLITPTNEGDGSADNSASLFECHVYISPVKNARIPQHELSDTLAWIAASSIGLDGFTDDDKHIWLYHQYHKGTMFGQRKNGDPNLISKLVGRFAAGVIATMDIAGPRTTAFGKTPWRGVLFKVDWDRTIGILFGICLTQMILGLLCCVVSNTAFVKDDSYLSTARLLRPLVERLGPSGCALTGSEIAETLKTKMVYGVRVDRSGKRHHLDLGEDIMPLGEENGFPGGWYDGEVEGMVMVKHEGGLVFGGGEKEREFEEELECFTVVHHMFMERLDLKELLVGNKKLKVD